jgi:dTDP-4-dehydrorhamnose reductase
MIIAVIGSTGMLGQALLREGVRRADKPIGLARSGADHNVDITDSDKLIRMMEQIRPDVVINAAAITSLATCERDNCSAYRVNARAVATLAKACAEKGTKLVQISTDHYYMSDGDGKHDERAPVQLVNDYARTKYAGEAFALTCPGALVVRTNIVGFRGKGQPTFVEWAIASLQAGTRMTLFDDFFTSSIHVQGCASALYDLISKNITGILNLASRDVCSKKDFIRLLAERLGVELANTTTGSVFEFMDARRAESLGLDVSEAERHLGYDLPTTQEVIDALVSEYREMVL